MVIHKFRAGGNTFYMLSEKHSRPAGTNSSLGTPEWVGSSSAGQAGNIAKRLAEISFSKDVTEETPKEPEQKPVQSSIQQHLRVIAGYLELTK